MKKQSRKSRGRRLPKAVGAGAHKPAPLAKLARPRLPPVFGRSRLLKALDTAIRQASMVWLEGSPGMGKTTLAAGWLAMRKDTSLWYQIDAGDRDPASFFHYLGVAVCDAAPRYRRPMPKLTPEYLYGIDTFTKNFFRELVRRLKRPFVIVFDNVQEAGADSMLYEILRQGLEELPSDCHAIMLSRARPPESFARARLDRRLAVFDRDKLRLTELESIQLVKFLSPRQSAAVSPEKARALHRLCDGWFAGMLMLTETLIPVLTAQTSSDDSAEQRLFDYFAGEVFARRDPAVKEFLMSTALFPSFTSEMSERLTGNAQAGDLLKELVRQHHFTEEHAGEHAEQQAGYRYHPLFRQFLIERGNSAWQPAEQARLRLQAARILEQSDQPDQALTLYLDAADVSETTRLILTMAPKLMASGRLATLSGTIERLPPQALNDQPWLLYWYGISRMPFDPLQSHAHLQRAFAALRGRNDTAGVLRAWSGLMDGIIHALSDFTQADSLIDVIDELGGRRVLQLSAELADHVTSRVFSALGCRRNDHPDFEFWRGRAFAVLESADDIELRLVTGFYLFTYHTWVGDRQRTQAISEMLSSIAAGTQASTLAKLTTALVESWYAWMSADHFVSIGKMEQALLLANETGVHIWDLLLLETGTASALTCGHLDLAAALLARLAPHIDRARVMDRHYYFHERAWLAMLKRDFASCLDYQEQALALAKATGLAFAQAEGHYGMAIVSHAIGNREAAFEHLGQARAHGDSLHSDLLDFTCRLAEAHFAFELGEEERGLRELRRSLKLGRERGYLTTTWWRPEMMSQLLGKAYRHGIEPDYVRRLIAKRELVPADGTASLGAWPYPITIYTLGRFSIFLDDQPLKFPSKAPKKPLGVLKALIALGGRSVDINKIMSALWQGQGRAARSAFDVALMRLRRLLRHPAALQLTEGKLTLNEQVCWVDIWGFERAISGTGRPDAAGYRDASNLYRGRFLERDGEASWIVNVRDRLTARYRRFILEQARAEEDAENWDAAVQIYRRALEHDNLTEEFHFRLMHCELRLGQHAEAIKTYRRCRELLSINLQTKPSAELESLYQRVLAGKSNVVAPH
jgi:LuxR family maltose regulon positive regulatory protein